MMRQQELKRPDSESITQDYPIKVLQVTHINKEIGGGHFVVSRLVNFFATHPSLGISPSVLMNNYEGFVSKFIDASVPWHPFEVPELVLAVGRRRMHLLGLVKASFSLMKFVLNFTTRITRICKKGQIKIMHVHSATALILMFLPAKIAGCRLVFHLHDAILSEAEGGSFDKVTKYIVSFAIRYVADEVIVVSEFVRQTVAHIDKGLASNTHVLHNGINIQDIRQKEIPIYKGSVLPQVVSFGVLGSRKGFHIGIQAISILKHEYGMQVRYRIIGDGPFRDDLVRLAQELTVSDLVEFMGFQEQVHRHVSQADIVLVPSVYEDPFPLVVLESMANSKIIIASQSGGIPEMIRNGEEGFLVLKDNPRQIAEKVAEIIKNPEKANEMADNAYNRVSHEFSIERMALDLVSIYHSVLDEVSRNRTDVEVRE